MTIYEQIQKSVECMESRMETGWLPFGESRAYRESDAREAGMSVRSYATWFWAVTGLTYREYLVRRRLERSIEPLAKTDARILDIALHTGYRSHEAFSRAFRDEFGITPRNFRKSRPALKGLEKIALIKEMYMGVIVKDLPEMLVVYFDGFSPNSEDKAHACLADWRKTCSPGKKPGRVFGHNITRSGQVDNNPQNEGYRVMATIGSIEEAGNAKTQIIRGGRFLVTGIEGNFENDPEGNWIRSGWERMKVMLTEKGLRPHAAPRWFEEALEPATPGNLRLDLYLEIGE